jgi:hypothetical protein
MNKLTVGLLDVQESRRFKRITGVLMVPAI